MLATVSCATGTLLALKRTMAGGVMPGGMTRLAAEETEEICAMAPPMSLPGSNQTLRMPRPVIDCESMREMPLTVVE